MCLYDILILIVVWGLLAAVTFYVAAIPAPKISVVATYGALLIDRLQIGFYMAFTTFCAAWPMPLAEKLIGVTAGLILTFISTAASHLDEYI